MHINKEEFKKKLVANVKTLSRKTIETATKEQIYEALVFTIRDYVTDKWIKTHETYDKIGCKIVCYLSMEFLMGRFLGNAILNMTMLNDVKSVLKEMNIDYNLLEDVERDPGLGNGGLGRLAACFLDSLSTLELPAYGCGIRYHYGIFEQRIENGYQIEAPDNWLQDGDMWGVKRPEYAVEVKFSGNVKAVRQEDGQYKFEQENYQSVIAVPYDYPVIGYNNNTVNTLRLWDAEAKNKFDLKSFNEGNYSKAVEEENLAKTLTDVLYPADEHYAGKELRLRQQYFFVSATLQRIMNKFVQKFGTDFSLLPEKYAFQLNDTHPSIAVAELMRLLVDEYNVAWDDAWEITKKCCAYTNHTIMSEALEKWPIEYLEEVVPQLIPIIKELDKRVRRKYKDKSVYIIDDEDRVHMAHMDIHYGFSVNGVAALHTDILKNQELKNFYDIYPEKFNNKTNGITFRRWLLHCNRQLSAYIEELIGSGFKQDASQLEKLMDFADNQAVFHKLAEIKREKKLEFKKFLQETQDVEINENSIMDVQVKRLHEYKRQQMNALYAIYKYLDIKAGNKPKTPITMIFGAKAAPAYVIAKDIIHLILCLQELIENDEEVRPYFRVLMIENYNVSKAAKIIPAADISEQISLASKEASGTGNMKFMLNGALTLGTEDGANVEIRDLVGDENIYIFGKKPQQVIDLYEEKGYCSKDIYEEDELIHKLVDFIVGKEMLAIGDEKNLKRLHKELVGKDWFMTLLDTKEYIETKEKVYQDYENQEEWNKKVLVNIAKAGFFSSDRTIEQYNKDIWKLK